MPSHKRRWIIEEYDDSYSIREENTNRELFGLTKFQVLYLFINDLDEFKYYNYNKKAEKCTCQKDFEINRHNSKLENGKVIHIRCGGEL